MTEALTYNVALNEGVDYDQFWSEIETAQAGGNYVPDRAVQIINERPASLRQCWYALTEEEAQTLRNDPRVFCVEFPPEFRDDIQAEGCTTQTGLWYKWDASVNPENNLGINWGLTRTDSRTNNTPDYPPQQGTFNHDYLCDGTGVDFVVVDGGIQPDHPEFTDANGVSRVQQIDWYAASGVSGTMPAFNTFYSDYNGHGTLVTGLAAGKIYGRAKNSRIYCMTVNVSRVNPTTFIPLSDAFDCIKGWHNNKPIDPATGFKRPTVVNLSVIFVNTYSDITGGNYRGTSWVGTTGQVQYGMTGSNNDGTGSYGERIDSIDTDVAELLAAGVHVVASNGNFYQIVDNVGGQDYNNYYTTSSGETKYYMRGGSPSAAPGVINVGGVSIYFTGPERIYDKGGKGPRTDVFAPSAGLVTSVSTVNVAGATTAYPTNSSYYIGAFSGTSVASPLVAGMVAQMLQAFPNYSPAAIRQLVKDYSTPNVLADLSTSDYSNPFGLYGAPNNFAYLPSDLTPYTAPTNGNVTFEQLFTFTRTTSGTFVGSNGFIQPAAINAPRFDYNPVTLAAKGLLIEEQRVNLLTQSNSFSTSPWSTSAAFTATPNQIISPDGTNTGWKVTLNTGSANLFQPVTATATSHTYTLYVKQGSSATTANVFGVRNNTTSTNLGFITINFSTGTFTGGGNASNTVTNVGNGWWRIEMVFTSGITVGNSLFVYAMSTTGTGNFAYIYGAQFEAGAFATSYIPTVASQVTRTADTCSITAPNFAPWYNQSEGTLAAEFTLLTRTLSGTAVIAFNGSANGRWSYLSSASTRMFDGTNTAVAGNIATPTAVNKTASALSSAGMAISLNGAAPGTSAYVGTFGTQNALDIGSQSGGTPINGHMRSIKYYPVRLSNLELQALTS